MVTAAMKLKDAYSLEEKYDQQASLQTKLVEVIEFQLSYLKS